VADPAIQPAGYAFSIWGVIYLWLLASAGFGLFRRADDPAWDVVRWPLIVSLGVGSGWLAVANVAPVAATMAIAIMLAGALGAFLLASESTDRWLLSTKLAKLEQWLLATSKTTDKKLFAVPLDKLAGWMFAVNKGTDRWLLSAPIAMLAGWLSAATAVSLGVVLTGYGWLSDTGSAVAMLGLVLALAVTVQMRKPQMPVYGATVIWALIGIIVKNGAGNLTVSLVAASGIVIVAFTIVAGLRRA